MLVAMLINVDLLHTAPTGIMSGAAKTSKCSRLDMKLFVQRELFRPNMSRPLG